MSGDLIEAVVASGASLPSPGAALYELQRVAADEQAGTKEFAKAICSDAALCGAIMRVANSAVFSPPRKSTNIEQAIATIGISKTFAVAAASALRNGLVGVPQNLKSEIEALLDAANRAAGISYAVARIVNHKSLADYAYLSTIMENAGHVLAIKHNGHISKHCTTDAHPATGERLMRNWKMPQIVIDAVGKHHKPKEAEDAGGDVYTLCCIMAVGRRIYEGPSNDWVDWVSHVEYKLGLHELALKKMQRELQ